MMRDNPISKAQGKIEHFLDQEVPQIVGWMVIVAVVFLFLFFSFIPGAEASNYRPPKQPERGAVEQIQNQGQSQNQGQTQHAHSSSESYASTDGNTQTLGVTQNYAERAVKAVLGGAYADSDPGSTAPCLESIRGWGIAGALSWTGKTKLNDRCWDEYLAQANHNRSMDEQRFLLEKAKLLNDAGYPSDAARLLGVGGGDKYTPQQLKSMEKEVAEYREKKVHGDIMK